MAEKKRNLLSETVFTLEKIADQLETLNTAVWDVALELSKISERMDTFADNAERSLSVLSNTTISATAANEESLKQRTKIAESLMRKEPEKQ